MRSSSMETPLRENPVFVGLVGLCPALFVTTHLSQSVILAVCTLLVLVAAAPILSIVEPRLSGRLGFLASVAIVGAITTIVEILLELLYPEMRHRLGVFVPLIAVNCLVLRLVGGSERQSSSEATVSAAYTGFAFLVALSTIALIRELLGTGGLAWGSASIAVPGVALGPVRLLGTSAGALLVLGYIRALVAHVRMTHNTEDVNS